MSHGNNERLYDESERREIRYGDDFKANGPFDYFVDRKSNLTTQERVGEAMHKTTALGAGLGAPFLEDHLRKQALEKNMDKLSLKFGNNPEHMQGLRAVHTEKLAERKFLPSLKIIGTGMLANAALDTVLFNDREPSGITTLTDIGAPLMILTKFSPQAKIACMVAMHVMSKLASPMHKTLFDRSEIGCGNNDTLTGFSHQYATSDSNKNYYKNQSTQKELTGLQAFEIIQKRFK